MFVKYLKWKCSILKMLGRVSFFFTVHVIPTKPQTGDLGFCHKSLVDRNPTSRSLKSLFWMEEGIFVDTYFKIKMKTQQLGPMVSGFFLFSFASSFGTFYRFLLESFDSLGPLFWGEEGTLPTSPTSPNLYCISPDSQTVLHHTPHFEILPPGTMNEGRHGGRLQVGPKNMGFVWKSETSKRMQRPTSTAAQPSDSRCQPYLRYNGAPP